MCLDTTPRAWEVKDAAGQPVQPARVERVHLPWLPSNPEAQALMVAAAQIGALLAASPRTFPVARTLSERGRAEDDQRTTEQRLHRLREGLLVLVPPTALGITPEPRGDSVYFHALEYLRNLTSVIPLWDELFVPTLLGTRMALDVVIGVRFEDDLAGVLWSPFQIPPGWVRYSAVPLGSVGGDVGMRPAGRVWADRPRVGLTDDDR